MATNIQDNAEEKLHNFEIENETIKQLLVLEKEFRQHNSLVKNEMNFQKELITRIWTLSQRYILLESTEPGCHYPEIYAGPTEDALLQEFTDKVRQIRSSNFRIKSSLIELRKTCLLFDSLCAQLDMTFESPLIIGDAFHKPISYFMELISDLFKYMHAWLLKLKFSAHQFDPLKIDSIDNYKKQIEISEDFEEYLTMGLTYCKCLRPKTIC